MEVNFIDDGSGCEEAEIAFIMFYWIIIIFSSL